MPSYPNQEYHCTGVQWIPKGGIAPGTTQRTAAPPHSTSHSNIISSSSNNIKITEYGDMISSRLFTRRDANAACPCCQTGRLVRRKFWKTSGKVRNIPESSGIFRKVPESSGIFGKIPESSGIFGKAPENLEKFRKKSLEKFGKLWKSLGLGWGVQKWKWGAKKFTDGAPRKTKGRQGHVRRGPRRALLRRAGVGWDRLRGQELAGTACEEIAWGRIGAELLCCTLARGLPSERRGQGGGGIASARECCGAEK